MEQVLNPNDVDIRRWCNDDNKFFYNMPLDIFKGYCHSSGIQNGCDIQLIYDNYLKPTESMIEIGAGYGRATSALLKCGYQGSVTALERNPTLVNALASIFKNTINIVSSDLKDYFPNTTYDVALWLWSGISEFSQNEQIRMLRHIKSFVKQQGFIIVDTLPTRLHQSNATNKINDTLVVQNDYTTGYFYSPDAKDITRYTSICDLTVERIIPYQSETHRDRVLFVLKC